MSDVIYNISSGFFDSVNGDRLYSAADMNKPYKRVIADGIFPTPQGTPSTDFQVVAVSGMSVAVLAGNAMIGARWAESADDVGITIAGNSSSSPRIDSIFLHIDTGMETRAAGVVYRQGTAGASPTAPAIVKTDNITELRLADILVAPSAAIITQANITDQRGGSECPWVAGLIQQVDTSALFDQYRAAYAAQQQDQADEWKTFMDHLARDYDISMSLRKHESTYTSTAAASIIPINIDGYDTTKDLLQVFVNGIFAVEGTHYIVKSAAQIQLTNAISAGQKVHFVVYKAVMGGAQPIIPTDEQVQDAVDAYMDAHPGALVVDPELSDTSVHAVQNKAVTAALTAVNGRLDPIVDALGVEQKTEKLPYDTVENGFYRNGAFTANTGYKSYSYTVTPQTEYLVTAYCVFGATGVGICQYFDSSDNLLSIENVESGATYTDYPITTPNNCTKLIVINKYDGSHTYDGGYGAVKSTVTVSNRLDNIESKIGFFAVDVNNDVISIVQPYSDTHDLRITMQKCGSSSLMQLFGFYFDAIAAGAESFSKVSSTDWLGPYKVLADSNPTQNIGSSWFYTGGWHGADNTVNSYPTGKTIEYKVFCDGEPVPSDGTKVKGNSVRVYVKNHICGNNTTDTTGGDDFRYILQEEITYDFSEDGKCYVQNLITALEDIHIREYYGLQIASNGGKWMSRQSIYGTDLVDVSLNNQNLSQAFLFNPQFLVAVDDNSNFVIAHTEHIGLGEETYNHYATGQGAHISNGKMYWDLIYAFPYLALASGQRAYVKGWYRWADSENIC